MIIILFRSCLFFPVISSFDILIIRDNKGIEIISKKEKIPRAPSSPASEFPEGASFPRPDPRLTPHLRVDARRADADERRPRIRGVSGAGAHDGAQGRPASLPTS